MMVKYIILVFFLVKTTFAEIIHQEQLVEKRNFQSNKWGDTAKLTRQNTTYRESDIAAVFRDVAYGILGGGKFPETTTEQQTTSSTTVTISTTKIYNKTSLDTKDEFFNKSKTIISNKFSHIEVDSDDNNKNLKNLTYNIINNNTLSPTLDEEIITRTRNNEFNYQTEILIKWSEIRTFLGLSWTFHVYVSALGFSILAGVSIIALFWGSWWPVELGRCRRTFLHLIVLTLASCRAIGLFLDPYGAIGLLPPIASLVLHHTVAPLITATLAVFLPVLLMAGQINILMLPPITLYIVSFFHVACSVGVDILNGMTLLQSQLISALRIMTQAITAGWGAVLCLGYVAALCKIVRKEELYNDNERYSNAHLNLMPTSVKQSILKQSTRVGTTGAMCQLLLSAITVYALISPADPPNPTPLLAWAWLFQNSAARFLEMTASYTILIAAGIIKISEPHDQGGIDNSKRQFICPFPESWCPCSCCYNTSDLHPSNNKSKQSMNIFTLQKKQEDSNTTDYITSDFQLVWSKTRSLQSAMKPNLVSEGGILKLQTNCGENLNLRNPKPFPTFPNRNQSYTLPRNLSNPKSSSLEGNYDNLCVGGLSMSTDPPFPPQTIYHQKMSKNMIISDYKMVHNNFQSHKRMTIPSMEKGEKNNLQSFNPGTSKNNKRQYLNSHASSPSTSGRSYQASRSLDFLGRSDPNVTKSSILEVQNEYYSESSSSLECLNSESMGGMIGEGNWNPIHTIPRRPKKPSLASSGGTLQSIDGDISIHSILHSTATSSSAPPTAPASGSSAATTPDEGNSHTSQESSIVTYVNTSHDHQ